MENLFKTPSDSFPYFNYSDSHCDMQEGYVFMNFKQDYNNLKKKKLHFFIDWLFLVKFRDYS